MVRIIVPVIGNAERQSMNQAMGAAEEAGEFSFFDLDGAKFRRTNNGAFRAIQDVLVGNEWKPNQSADKLKPALFGDEIDHALGKGGNDGEGPSGGGDVMARSV